MEFLKKLLSVILVYVGALVTHTVLDMLFQGFALAFLLFGALGIGMIWMASRLWSYWLLWLGVTLVIRGIGSLLGGSPVLGVILCMVGVPIALAEIATARARRRSAEP